MLVFDRKSLFLPPLPGYGVVPLRSPADWVGRFTSAWPGLNSSLAFLASRSKRTFIRSRSFSDNSSMSSNVFRAALVARINSSSFNCTASLSRFWALRIRKIIKKVMMVATVLMTSSQVLSK